MTDLMVTQSSVISCTCIAVSRQICATSQSGSTMPARGAAAPDFMFTQAKYLVCKVEAMEHGDLVGGFTYEMMIFHSDVRLPFNNVIR